MGLDLTAILVDPAELCRGLLFDRQLGQGSWAEGAGYAGAEPTLSSGLALSLWHEGEPFRVDKDSLGIHAIETLDAPTGDPGGVAGRLGVELGQGGGAAVGDALSLLAPPEAQHRVKTEGIAEPLRLDGHEMQVERLPGGPRALGVELLVDRANISLHLGVGVDFPVIDEGLRPFAQA